MAAKHRLVVDRRPRDIAGGVERAGEPGLRIRVVRRKPHRRAKRLRRIRGPADVEQRVAEVQMRGQ